MANLHYTLGDLLKTPMIRESLSSLGLLEKAYAEADTDYVLWRAENIKIDVVGRLAWIEDAFEMIQHARKSLP